MNSTSLTATVLSTSPGPPEVVQPAPDRGAVSSIWSGPETSVQLAPHGARRRRRGSRVHDREALELDPPGVGRGIQQDDESDVVFADRELTLPQSGAADEGFHARFRSVLTWVRAIVGRGGVKALATVVVALAVVLGCGSRPAPSGAASASTPSAGPSGAVAATQFGGAFVPAAIAATDANHAWVVGATSDATAGVVEWTADGGTTWTGARLASGPIVDAAAAGRTVLLVVGCAEGWTTGCRIVSHDGGATWTSAPGFRVWAPTLVDETHGYALSEPMTGGMSTLQVFDADVAHTNQSTAPCDQRALTAVDVNAAGDGSTVWFACVGPDHGAEQAKSVVRAEGQPFIESSAVVASVGGGDEVGRLPIGGTFGGITMASATRGWIWTDPDGLYATSDGGVTWSAFAPPSGDLGGTIVDAALTAEGVGFVVVSDSTGSRVVRVDAAGTGTTVIASYPLLH